MRIVVLLFAMLSFQASRMSAQTFMQHLRERVAGQGTVTVTQSKTIDALVNGANVNPPSSVQPVRKKTSVTAHPDSAGKKTPVVRHHTPPATHHEEKSDSTRKERKTEPTAERKEREQPVEETEEPVVDMRKKLPRRSYKVNGYRVQVFAGGNSRNDKIRAQRAGNAVKMAMPEQPVYVHFYSPRWICRVGNFRSYEEASAVLRQVRKLGYRQACIVSGKITVAY